MFVGDLPCCNVQGVGLQSFLGVFFVGILVKVHINKECSNISGVMFASASQRAEQDILRER